jgi:hypothetical protein
MNKPTFKGRIDTLPDIKVSTVQLIKEYNQYIEPLMEDVVDQHNSVLVQRRYHITDYSIIPETAKITETLRESFDFTHVSYRLVMPNTCYNWHHDPGEVCYHIPLITNPGCWFVYENRSFHMPVNNSVYIVNNGRKHTFVNAGNEPRLHLTFMDFGTNNQNTY